MDRSQVLVCIGIFTSANVATKLLSKAGYEDAPLMVLAAGLIAAAALAYLRVRADHKR